MSNFKMPVSDYMSDTLVAVSPETTSVDADRLLDAHEISALAVLDGERLVGVISRTDLLNASSGESGQAFGLPSCPVRDLMTAKVICVPADAPLDSVAATMLERRIHRVFVEKDGKPVGVISTRDLMRAVHRERIAEPAIEIATKSVVSVNADDTLSHALACLEDSNKHGLVVVEEGWPVGTFSQVDALLSRARDPRTLVDEVMNLSLLALPPTIPAYRAAGQALALDVRRILLVEDDQIRGVVSTFDFARLVR